MQDSRSGARCALRVAALVVVASVLLAALETALFGVREDARPAAVVFRFGLVDAALLLNVALVLAASISIGAWALAPRWERREVRLLATALGVGLLTAACGAFAAELFAGAGVTRILGSAKMPATLALCGGLVAAVVLVCIGGRQLARRRPELGRAAVLVWGVGLFSTALIAQLANQRFYVGLYPEIHGALALTTAILTIALLWWMGCLRNPRPEAMVAIALLALVAGVSGGVHAHRTLTEQQRLLGAILREATIGREALSLTWAATDRDGDGHSPVFGGGDCDDADASSHPGAPEVAGNGVDEDCMSGDLPVRQPPRERKDQRPPPTPAKPTRETLPDILLFSVDALRADRLPCKSSVKSNTPSMDRVVARGTCFSNAYVSSTSSATSLPAIAAGVYFSNLYPEVKAGGSASPRDVPPTRTFLNDLADHGYRVIATVPRSFRGYFQDRGIEWSAPSGLSTPNLAALLRQVEDGPDAPLALWFHHMDAHLSYSLEFLKEFQGTGPNAEVNRRYDAGVARVDRDLRTLLEWQLGRSRLDDTVVVITADHGEELSEHGGFGHARGLYEEVLRVPLIISLPGRAKRVVHERVGIVDLVPTLREFVGLEPDERSDGVSLVPFLEGRPLSHPPVYAENFLSSKNRAVVRGDWKLIHNLQGNVYELYNIREDPLEQNNRVDADPSRLSALQNLLAVCSAEGCKGIDPQTLADIDSTLATP
jgi:arylsulfatase A-like enzyme